MSSTVVLIGVADSVGQLIREHRSVERALVQIQMPRTSASELTEIATKGIAAARMAIAGVAVARITALSQGLSHYTHLLTQLAAQAALRRAMHPRRRRHVGGAVTRAIERAQQSIVEAYREAIAGRPGTTYPCVLLACALAQEDESGLFASSDAGEPSSRILQKPSKTSAFARHLEDLSTNRAVPSSRRPVASERRATGSPTRSSNPTSPCAESPRASSTPATSTPAVRRDNDRSPPGTRRMTAARTSPSSP